VALNGRRLGLYVLKEGFTEDFLSCYFKNVGGNLLTSQMRVTTSISSLKRGSIRAPIRNRTALKALAGAALDPDPRNRWETLEKVLEVDEFVSVHGHWRCWFAIATELPGAK
jgi:hypothetical protein